jgi:hypothetical protein
MDFVRSHFGKMTNMLKKVFNWSEVHLSEVTSYKIHTLMVFLAIHLNHYCSGKTRMAFIKVIEDDENQSYQPEPEKPEFDNPVTGKPETEVEPETEPETGKPEINHQKSSFSGRNNVNSSSTRLIPGIIGVVLLFFLVN